MSDINNKPHSAEQATTKAAESVEKKTPVAGKEAGKAAAPALKITGIHPSKATVSAIKPLAPAQDKNKAFSLAGPGATAEKEESKESSASAAADTRPPRPERPQRPERPARPERPVRPAAAPGERPAREERPARPPRPERPARAGQGQAVEGKKVATKDQPKKKQISLWEIFIRGIWKENPGLCQLLGMCPLLAVTTSAANALGLGIATIIVMVLSSMVISLIRKVIVPEVRIPVYVVVIASLVTAVRFEVEANYPELYQQLGIYLSLIVTNCIIMARAEAFAAHNNILRSTIDAIACAIGFTLVLFALGAVREIIGNGTFFIGAADLLGPWAKSLEVTLFSQDYTYLIAILPPGGFFVLAFLIAIKNTMDSHARRRAERKARIKALHI